MVELYAGAAFDVVEGRSEGAEVVGLGRVVRDEW